MHGQGATHALAEFDARNASSAISCRAEYLGSAFEEIAMLSMLCKRFKPWEIC